MRTHYIQSRHDTDITLVCTFTSSLLIYLECRVSIPPCQHIIPCCMSKMYESASEGVHDSWTSRRASSPPPPVAENKVFMFSSFIWDNLVLFWYLVLNIRCVQVSYDLSTHAWYIVRVFSRYIRTYDTCGSRIHW